MFHHLTRKIRLLLLWLLSFAWRLIVGNPKSLSHAYQYNTTKHARILFIKPDHLGDVLLATPALQHLRSNFPEATIVAIVGPWSAGILKNNACVDTLLTLPFPAFDRAAQRAHLLRPYQMLGYYAALVRAGHFDVALIARDDHWWGAMLAFLAGIPVRVGYAVPECVPFLSTSLPWNPSQHVTEQALALVDVLLVDEEKKGVAGEGVAHYAPTGEGVARDAPTGEGVAHHVPTGEGVAHHVPTGEGVARNAPTILTSYVPSQHDHDWAGDWLQHHHITPPNPLVILHPGTGGETKLWILERWVAVANILVERLNAHILLTGGPGEEALAETIASMIHTKPYVLAGKTSIGQLTALLAHADLVLGVDSGPMHLAVSQQTPTVHLYGPSNAERFGPWGEKRRHVVLRSQLWCSPCNVFDACPRHTMPSECMVTITVDQVVAASLELLSPNP